MRIRGLRKITRWLSRGRRSEAGFTLIEVLVVIIVIGVLAAIAIPTFLGQRGKAQDSAAHTLVRNGLTVLLSASVDTNGFDGLSVALLNESEPTVNWVEVTGIDLVDVDAPSIDSGFEAAVSEREIAFCVESNSRVDVASRSESGNLYGIQVDLRDVSQNGYVQVKVTTESDPELGW